MFVSVYCLVFHLKNVYMDVLQKHQVKINVINGYSMLKIINDDVFKELLMKNNKNHQ